MDKEFLIFIKKILVVGYFSSDPNVYTYAISFYNTFQKLDYCVEKFNCKKKSSGRFSFVNNYFSNLDLYIRAGLFQSRDNNFSLSNC